MNDQTKFTIAAAASALQHVKVLAVDQIANERQENPTVAKAVTLELDTDHR